MHPIRFSLFAVPLVISGMAARLPNVNDGYRDKAPDPGAYEEGRELPVYGPRPPGMDEESPWRK